MPERIDCPFRAVAIDDETGAEFDSADYDDLDEAARFANRRHWDYVIDIRTNRIVWRYGMPVRGETPHRDAVNRPGPRPKNDNRNRGRRENHNSRHKTKKGE